MTTLEQLYMEFREASLEVPLNTEKLKELVARIEFYERLTRSAYMTDN